MLKDILGQAWEAMLYNRRRTAITMIGMAWGIATVVLLLAYGAGFSRAIENIFAQWGTSTIGLWPGRTSEQAGGDKAGAWIRFTLDDVDRIANTVPGITYISPANYKDVTVQNDLHSHVFAHGGRDIGNAGNAVGDAIHIVHGEADFHARLISAGLLAGAAGKDADDVGAPAWQRWPQWRG